ncbi:MAG: hypothetical protein PHR53_00575 [Bacteroidales bacterium]|nr:hypothetical protein [Bacteroidales bacterium]
MILLASLLTFCIISCKKDNNNKPEPFVDPTVGTYNKEYMASLTGFFEQRPSLLESNEVSVAEFIRISTDSSWGLSVDERTKLKTIRNLVDFPTHKILLQKAVTLYDMENYVSNKYGGTVGGFISVAGDVKSLHTLRDVYWGLRLDYPGTYWDTTGPGYAVIRFTSNCVSTLYIPYSPEMGGDYPHSWPNTGGGFTASTLGNGGFPEYVFSGYHAPNEGGEIYQISSDGSETLVATFTDNQWVKIGETEKSAFKNPVRNGIFARHQGNLYATTTLENGDYKIIDQNINIHEVTSFVEIATFAEYQGATFYVRGCDGSNYFLTTTDTEIQRKMNLKPIEKGIYEIIVPMQEVTSISEEITNL